MKKLIMFIAVITSLSAQSKNPIQDAVLVGNHFTATPVAMYEFEGEFDVEYLGESREDEVYAWMNPDGAFIRMEIAGKDAVSLGDEPVYSFPKPNAGEVTRVWLSLNGYDKYGKRVCGGYVIARYPKEGSVLNFTVYINSVNLIIDVEIPSGISKDKTYLTINDRGGYHYDTSLGGYNSYYNPTIGEQTYKIWFDGTIIASGIIDSMTQELVPDQPEGLSVKLSLPADLEIADFSDLEKLHLPYEYLKTTLTAQTTLVSGELEDTKVFSVIRSTEVNRGVDIEIKRLVQAKITVFAAGPNGEIIMVDSILMSRKWGRIYFNLYSSEYKKLFFAITEVQFENEMFDQTFDVTIGTGKG